jgi:AsmA family/AsmA-like C-terminal region
MSIWKSPVFYFGVVLLLVVGGALLAPFVIDWGQYKPDLQRYGERLTGRAVEINGPVSVRLFPFPRLQAEKVSIANGDTADTGVFATADQVMVRIGLDGLFSGELRVEQINVIKPVFNLLRARDGEGNWNLNPQEVLRNSPLLDKVRLDRINVIDGTLRFVDEARATALSVDAIQGTFSAPVIQGPWRATGSAALGGVDGDFVLTSSVRVAGQPLRVGFKIDPKDTTWPSFSFDGSIERAKTKGKVRLDPTVIENAKGDPEGKFRPLALQADVLVTDTNAALTGIKITPADTNDGSTLIEGSITADFSSQVKINADFDSPRLNLDALFGAKSLDMWRAGGVLAMFNQAMVRFPAGLELSSRFRANALTAGQETLENVDIVAQTERDAIRIKRFSANLPGRSRVLADGIVFQNEGSADFGGKLALESNDVRLLAGWLWPNSKAAMATQWTGARGQLKLQSDVNWSEARTGFSDIAFEFDGERGSGTVLIGTGNTPTLDLKLQTSAFNVDNYITGKAGVQLWRDTIGWLVEPRVAKRMTLEVGSVTLNGTDAQDMVLDAETGLGGLNLKTFAIGSVGGAHVNAKGRLIDNEGTYEGSIDAAVTADDPLPLLRLAGWQQNGVVPPWQMVLGKTALKGRLLFRRGNNEPDVAYVVDGTSGPVEIAISTKLSDLAAAGGPNTKGVARVSTTDGSHILRILGLDPKRPDGTSGTLNVAFDGSMTHGYALEIDGSAYGARGTFNGVYQVSTNPLPAVDGAVAVKFADAVPLLRAFGLPFAPVLPHGMEVSATIKPQLEALRIVDLKAAAGGAALTGEISILPDYSLTADLAGGDADLRQLLGAAFIPWDGRDMALDTAYADRPPFGLNGEIWYRPESLTLWDKSTVREGVVGFQFEGRERHVTVAGRDAAGEQVSFEAAILPSDGQYALATAGRIPVDLASISKTTDGMPVLNGRVVVDFKSSGIGLSPHASLSGMSGSGKITLTDAMILNFAPGTFSRKITAVQKSADLREAVASLQAKENLPLADAALGFKITAGRAAIEPFGTEQDGASVVITGEADLVEQNMAATVKLMVKALGDVPTVDMQISGPPGGLRKRVETSALAGKLGYEIMAREMAELERVQAEQQRALELEARQRKLDDERYVAYLEQRAELRLRQRELKVHAAQRERDARLSAAQLQAALPEYAAMNKADLVRRVREARIIGLTANGRVSKPVKSKRVVPEQLPDGVDLPRFFNLDGIAPAVP